MIRYEKVVREPAQPIRFSMPLVYEDGAWRIDDWFNWNHKERGFEGSMKEEARRYIVWYTEQLPRFTRGE